MELEDQIDTLIQKSNKDLKTRIIRLVIRQQNKLLKDQAREFKTNGRVVQHKVSTSSKDRKTRKSKDSKYHSDSDSDGYYSD